MKKRTVGALLFIAVLMHAQSVFSAPSLINYQGVLTNISGRAVTGPVTMTFEIFDAENNGTSLWPAETHSGVVLQDGVYNVILGSVNTNTLTSDLFTDDESWLEVTVNGETLSPRQPITSVVYAHNADMLDGVDSTGYLSISNTADTTLAGALNLPVNGLTVGTNQLVAANGNVGIGTSTPGSTLDIVGNIAVSGTVDGRNIAADGAKVDAADTTNDSWTGTGNVSTISGNVGIGTTSPTQELDIIGDIRLEDTTNSDTGVIYKGAVSFIHNFQHPTGGTAKPEGRNFFAGKYAGNFTMGSDAIATWYASSNTGIGYASFSSNTIGYENTAVGFASLLENTTGYYNTAIGSNALRNNISGHGNVAVGDRAGSSSACQTSTNSIYIGVDTKPSASGTTNENVFGYEAVGVGSNSVVLGNDSITKTVLKGNVGIGTASPIDKLSVHGGLTVDGVGSGGLGIIRIRQDGIMKWSFLTAGWVGDDLLLRNETTGVDVLEFDAATNNVGVGGGPNASYKLRVYGTAGGTSWTNIPSKDYKENITQVSKNENPMMLASIMDMDLTTYKYKEEYGGDGTTKLGFIAEEMPKEVLSKDGKGVDVYELLAFTIGAMQAQQKDIEELDTLKAENETLKEQTALLQELVCQDHPTAALCQ